MKILVVGAGVLGLTTAFNLVEDGHDVTIVDKTGPYAQASNRSFAWINANHKLPTEYHRLNRAGIAAHEEFQKRFASHGTWFHQNGCIMFDSSPNNATGLDERFTESVDFDYPVECIDSGRLRELEPTVNWPTESGLFFPIEAHLDNEAFCSLVKGFLEESEVEPEIAEVVRVETSADGASVEFAGGGTRNFDQVIIAAGADSGAIADRSGLLLPVADLSHPGPRTHSLLGVTARQRPSLTFRLTAHRCNEVILPRTVTDAELCGGRDANGEGCSTNGTSARDRARRRPVGRIPPAFIRFRFSASARTDRRKSQTHSATWCGEVAAQASSSAIRLLRADAERTAGCRRCGSSRLHPGCRCGRRRRIRPSCRLPSRR
jgi:glycine/D-amino acid oxidase-like deaminating enzyme